MIPIAIGVTLVVFSLVHIAPGEPIDSIITDDATAADVAFFKKLYGFDKPLYVQYGLWIGRAARGDLGTSIGTGRPVIEDLVDASKNTLLLAFFAALFGFTTAVVLGTLAGYLHGQFLDKVFSSVAISGVSVPNYWLGIVLVVIFSVELGWMPSMGMGPSTAPDWAWDLTHFRHVVLPMIAISAIPSAIIARSMRACIAEILNQEFVEALRSKGMPERKVLVHVLRNAAPTVLAVMGLQMARLMGGSILVEVIFAWPGTGFLLNLAIFRRDLPVLQGTILVLALFFVAMNLIVDILQTAVDPRIKRA